MKTERLPGGVNNPLWLHEQNYRMLLRLVPDIAVRYPGPARLEGEYQPCIELRDQLRYTSLVHLAKRFPSALGQIPELRMEIRMYHDAKVAEVVGYQGNGRLPAPYQVCVNGEYLRDEKRQVNLLLHELLSYSLRNGNAKDAVKN